MENIRPPKVDAKVFIRFQRASYFYHGQKWGSTKKELENAMLNVLEDGHLADADKRAMNYDGEIPLEFPPEGSIKHELTTADHDEDKMIKEFFDEFDIGPIYFKDKVTTEYLKNIVKKFTGNDSKYNWREIWSKKLRASGRVDNINGTNMWKVNRHNFVNIPDDLKEAYEKRIETRGLTIFKMHEDKATIVYNKLNIGDLVSLKQICKIAKLPKNRKGELEGKKIIVKLMEEDKIEEDIRGRWKVVDPTSISISSDNLVNRAGD